MTRTNRTTPARRPRRRDPKPPPNRLVAMFAVLAVGFFGILFRLVVLQVKNAAAYQEMARDQRLRTVTLPASRGTIFDRGGHELALSLPAKAVFADPQVVADAEAHSKLVAATLGLDPADVYERMTRQGTRFVYLARGVDPSVAETLEAKKLPGIGFLDESRRHYPAGALAPQVVGFVGVDGHGLAGLERQHEDRLNGEPGRMIVERGPNGVLIPQATAQEVPPVAGDDLVLTIDKDIQYRAQTALATHVKKNRAKGGTVIVLDPRTGDILAMATYPWFDPNSIEDEDPDHFRNRAVTDVYEPGSVNKVVTASAAVEERILKLSEPMYVPDSLQLYDKLFRDSHPHPIQAMTLADVIAYSSNIGTIMTARMLGVTRFHGYLERFGFGDTTGLGFPGESAGILAPPDRWSGVDIGTIPIGQGIAVTPLQMAAVYATVANGGVWVQPRLLRGTVDAGGRFHAAPPPETRRVVSETTARIVSQMLAYAVEVGTGTEAQIPGFWVAGKTGTARKPFEDKLGYSEKYVASFIGFTPASRPALVVAAVLDEPATVFGGIASAPLFRDVARFTLARLQVPPAPKPPVPLHAIPTG